MRCRSSAARDDAVLEEPVEGSPGECGDGRGALVVVDLCVGQPGAVVDDRVHVLPADTPGARVRSPVSACPGASKRPKLLTSMCSRLPGHGHS